MIDAPKMLVNGVHGRPAITNSREIDVTFSNLDTDASVRFAVNNFDYPSEYTALAKNMPVILPGYKGVNFVNAEIRFDDGSTKHFYQRVEYDNPNMEINGGYRNHQPKGCRAQFSERVI